MSASPLFFDRFELQPLQRRLLRDGEPVALGARAFDLLLALAGREGSLVTKGELLDRVWSGLVVEENNIAAQVTALRKAIGNELIATVPGRGYRFTAALRAAIRAAPKALPSNR
ncbi:MAG: transcriptional regulator, partial [Aquincola tertiaricarbonis]